MTTTDLSNEMLAEVSHEHRRWGGTFPKCKRCHEAWPCVARKTADEVRTLRAKVEATEARAHRERNDSIEVEEAWERATERAVLAEQRLAGLRERISAHLLTHVGGDESQPWQAGHNYAMTEAARLVREEWDALAPQVQDNPNA